MRYSILAFTALLACNGPQPDDTSVELDTDVDVDGDYDFDSRFQPGESSVSYGGQVMRQVLIDDMASYLGDLDSELQTGAATPATGDVEAALDFYFSFDSTVGGSAPVLIQSEPAPAQSTYDAISTGKNLVGKLAGNDPTGQHKDWSTEFAGWQHDDVDTPESLVRLWFSELDARGADWAAGSYELDPDGAPVPAFYVSAAGHDYRQLLEKFLRGAIAFSQGTDDYLDDDLDGKGLHSSHDVAVEGKPYTELEHAWDEGFGYFGASRSYGSWTDDEIAKGFQDTDGDGAIDLEREFCFGHSVNAAKRDVGANAPTDMTGDAWGAFVDGRRLLANADGPLSADQLAELQGHRDVAITAWEEAIAASVVHYINETLLDMGAFGTDAYDFGDHAKHWSEGKGFALSFQFNPRSPMTDAEFLELHDLLGQAPALSTDSAEDIAAYRADLLAARTLIGEAYGFDAANLGDDDGHNGW